MTVEDLLFLFELVCITPPPPLGLTVGDLLLLLGLVCIAPTLGLTVEDLLLLFGLGYWGLTPPSLWIWLFGIDKLTLFECDWRLHTHPFGIDWRLTWKCQIDKISNKISKCMGVLNRLKRFLPIEIKALIYNSLVVSHLNCGLLIWDFKCENITKLQKKVVRILSLSKYDAHTEPLSNSWNFLKSCIYLNLKN